MLLVNVGPICSHSAVHIPDAASGVNDKHVQTQVLVVDSSWKIVLAHPITTERFR